MAQENQEGQTIVFIKFETKDRQIRNRKIIIQGTRTPSDKDFGTWLQYKYVTERPMHYVKFEIDK